jgi:hypothetical protein
MRIAQIAPLHEAVPPRSWMSCGPRSTHLWPGLRRKPT